MNLVNPDVTRCSICSMQGLRGMGDWQILENFKMPGKHTVDGRKHQLNMENLHHYLQGFMYVRWVAGFLNHQLLESTLC